ncbi:MAG: terpene cyclase/mutase family protein [Planctomycetes bacterium]|nr:terpene cyclase/mutase family protein [Planctomycetota bacterium]
MSRYKSLIVLAFGLLSFFLWTAQAPAEDPYDPETLRAIDKATAWLLAAQQPDGSWSCDIQGQGDVGTTCVAALALMSAGNTRQRGRHHQAIKRATAFVLQHARQMDGSVYPAGAATQPQYKIGHHIHTYFTVIFFSQALGMLGDAELDNQIASELARLVGYIDRTQQADGSWNDSSTEPMITTVIAWEALRSAFSAGIEIQAAGVDKTLQYIRESCYDPASGIFRDLRWGGASNLRFITQGGALRVLYGMGEGKTEMAKKGTEALFHTTFAQDYGGSAGGEDFLGALFATQALLHEEGATWQRWWGTTRKTLADLQNADGSWTGHHCITGRTFCTATALWTLLLPKRILPMTQM